MIIDNFEKISQLPKNEQSIVKSLFEDLIEINNKLNSHRNSYIRFDIDWQDYHDEYSPERIDPCPDYYGYYSIVCDNERIGDKMTLNELDTNLFTLFEFVSKIYN